MAINAASTPSENLTSADAADILSRVGERVRHAREEKGIPRRVLSDMSGVSPRYLAQLEAGAGNISIALLQRVAFALDHRVEWFLADDDPLSSEALRMADLYRHAPEDVRDAVLEMLSPDQQPGGRARRICLVGLRGAGKSTLGRLAGHALDIPFVELNDEIEAQSGIPVDEVMALYGPEGYRKLEAQALDGVIANHDKMVLAVAGGIVGEPETYNSLLAHFHTIWVKTSPDEHMSRVRAQGDERPMAGNPAAMEQLRSILMSREAHYEKAQAVLDTSGQPVDRSLSDLLQLIQDQRFLI